eukprot:s2287_g2.t1
MAGLQPAENHGDDWNMVTNRPGHSLQFDAFDLPHNACLLFDALSDALICSFLFFQWLSDLPSAPRGGGLPRGANGRGMHLLNLAIFRGKRKVCFASQEPTKDEMSRLPLEEIIEMRMQDCNCAVGRVNQLQLLQRLLQPAATAGFAQRILGSRHVAISHAGTLFMRLASERNG